MEYSMENGRRHKRFFFAALAISTSFLTALVFTELLARVFFPPPPDVVFKGYDRKEFYRKEGEANARSADNSDPVGRALYIDTPTGRRLRPEIQVMVQRHWVSGKDVLIRTNSLGYRNREIGEKKLPRALFLGDSITCADYLDEEDSFVRQVEKISAGRGRPLETVNAGVGSVGIYDELAVLLETGIGVRPDIVVLCFYLNDVQSSPGIRLVRLPGLLRKSRLLYYSSLRLASRDYETENRFGIAEKTAMFDRWQAEFEKSNEFGGGDPMKDRKAFNSLILKNFRDWGCAWSRGAWEFMLPAFKDFRRQADIHGFKLYMAVFPVRAQVEAEFLEDFPQRKAAETASALGIPVLDLLPALRKLHAQGGHELFFDHCHPTGYANKFIAGEICCFLQEPVINGKKP